MFLPLTLMPRGRICSIHSWRVVSMAISVTKNKKTKHSSDHNRQHTNDNRKVHTIISSVQSLHHIGSQVLCTNVLCRQGWNGVRHGGGSWSSNGKWEIEIRCATVRVEDRICVGLCFCVLGSRRILPENKRTRMVCWLLIFNQISWQIADSTQFYIVFVPDVTGPFFNKSRKNRNCTVQFEHILHTLPHYSRN